MIPYGRQDISEEDIQAVVEVLRSDFLTQGPMVPVFEQSIVNYCKVKYAVAVNSATSALHIACLALDLNKGDWLWTSPITFVASANCALYCGAEVDFVDIDPVSYNMSPKALEEKLINAEKAGCLPKIVIVVHLCGQSCDMQAIHELSRRYGFAIIEDASHAIGGHYHKNKIGSCKYSDITVFSFHPVKIITTGEGGMAVTNDKHLMAKMELLRSHGVTRNPEIMNAPTDGDWYYQQVELGFNYRMTEMQAALGYSQMSRLDEYVTKRHELVQNYDHMLARLPLTTPKQTSDIYSAFHLYVIRVAAEKRKETFNLLRENQIAANVHYIPVYSQPYYQKLYAYDSRDYIEAEKYYAEAISLPLFPKLELSQQQHVVKILEQALT